MAMEAIMAHLVCCQSSKVAGALEPQARKANVSKEPPQAPLVNTLLEQRAAKVRSPHKNEQTKSKLTKEPSNLSRDADDADWYSCTSRMLTDEGVPHAAEAPLAPYSSRIQRPHFMPSATTSSTSLATVCEHHRQSSSGLSVPAATPSLKRPASEPVKSPAHGFAQLPGVASPTVAPAVPASLPNLLPRRGTSVEAVEKPKLASAPEEPTLKTDFSGKWCMTHAEGDFGQLLADAGVSWALRRIAKSMNFGLGVTFQNITQNGDSFVLEHVTPLKSTTMEFEAGSGYQETMGADGSPILVDAKFDGTYLIIQSKRAGGRSYVPARRYLQGDVMVIEAPISTGGTLKRFFKRSATG